MSDPICEKIAQAFLAKLQAIDAFAGLNVYRNRDASVMQYPALILFDGDMISNNETSGMTAYEMTLTVDGFVSPVLQENLGRDRNALYAEVVKAGLSDVTLGGLSFDISEGAVNVQLNKEIGQTPLGYFTVPFTIKFWTKPGDPYTLGP